MSQVEPPVVDGRRARRDRGRLAVIDAMVELVEAGHRPPAVAAVAERAGVSVASIFRYFDNLDDLQRETIERFLDRYAPLLEIEDIGTGPLDARIGRYVGARLALYEKIAPMARLVRARALDQPLLAATLGGMRLRLADQARQHFLPELRGRRPAARADLVGSIVTLTSFESWDQLRHELDATGPTVRRAWRSGVRALCAPSR